MAQFLIQSFIFLLSSLSTIGLIYINAYYKLYQPLIPILLVIDILIIRKIDAQKGFLNPPKLLALFISSTLVQLVVISSGGFYSPLLILLHLFTIGAIFVLNNSAGVSFLIFSLGILIFHTTYDQNIAQFFRDDPWTIVIYGLSIIIIIPLALYLSKSNDAKNKFTSFLKDYIDISERRQKSILTALSNLVIVTDDKLVIISVNTALERLLRISSSQALGKHLFETITLKDDYGNVVTEDQLPIKQVLKDKATHFVEGYSLDTKIQTLPKPVVIQIKPVSNSRGEITQIVFVLTDPFIKVGFNTHPSIEQAAKRHDSLLSSITNPETVLYPSSIQLLILLIAHIEEDILIAQEMEDHPLQEVIGFEDLVVFVRRIIESKKHLYTLLGAMPVLVFDDEDKSEAAFLNMINTDLTKIAIPSKYSAPIDSYLLKIILEKMLDLAVFVTGSQPGKEVKVNLSLDSSNMILLNITFPCGYLDEKDLPNLFIKDYPGLKFSRLKDSSGLEGYLANKIAKTIQLDDTAKLNPYAKTINLSVTIPKHPKITES